MLSNDFMKLHKLLGNARHRYLLFIRQCVDNEENYRLTSSSDSSNYALCFAIYGYRLILANDLIDANREIWDLKLRNGLTALQVERERVAVLNKDKPFLQLLTFTLSALSILGTLERDPLTATVVGLLPADIETALHDSNSLRGVARSGNQGMFLGVLLIYAKDYLGMNTQEEISRWLALHLTAMNRFGFWGLSKSMSHLQFQNGYHQYELLEYLHAEGVPWATASDAVASLADEEGHFAPYPGGGGCYDYDAVFFLTSTRESALRHRDLLMRTALSILSEQNADGGFCESQRIRPRSLDNINRSVSHVFAGCGRARLERLRSAITLLRPRHDRIHTHWSNYSREWGESDLWDSWFRMLTLARIDCAFDPNRSKEWGFIDFPGIGYHPSFRLNRGL